MKINYLIKILVFLAITSIFFLSLAGFASASPICGSRPDLSLNTTQVHWSTYSDYVARLLSIGYQLDNASETDAFKIDIVGAAGTDGADLVTSLPVTIGDVASGEHASFTVRYNVPPGVHRFVSRIKATAQDSCANTYDYHGLTDLDNPSVELRMVGHVYDAARLNGADGLDVEGNYAYVVSGFSNDLTIIDVSNPATPVIVANLTDPQGRLNRAWGVSVSGNYAYVAAGFSGSSDRLTVVDVSNPSQPAIVGSVQDHTNLDGALHVFMSGQYAYVTAPEGNRMSIIDVSDPRNPGVVGSVRDDIRLYAADGIFVSGDHAFAISHQLDGGTEKSYLNAIDVSDPAHPAIISSLNSTYFRGGDQMYISGRYMYVPGSLDHTFSIVDIANPAQMVIVSHITDDTYIGQSCFVDSAGRYAYLTSVDTNRLTLLDITDVYAPRIVGSIQDPVNLMRALYVIVSGNYAYVTSPGGTLSVIEIIET